MQDASRSGVISPAELLITERLSSRLARTKNAERELYAFRELSSAAMRDPADAIRRFLDLAIELCPSAGSSGISELETDELGEPIFRWTALAGAFAPYVGGSTPRNFSPCGLCLDRRSTILVERPGRVFTYFNDAEPAIVEGLVVPLGGSGDDPLGTIWVVSHSEETRGFDRTDAQVIENLAVQVQLTLRLARLQAAEHRVGAAPLNGDDRPSATA
jgi:hypothetical protein